MFILEELFFGAIYWLMAAWSSYALTGWFLLISVKYIFGSPTANSWARPKYFGVHYISERQVTQIPKPSG